MASDHDEKIVARKSSRKSSSMGAPVKVRILRLLDDKVRWFMAKAIAREVKANEAYVRKCCRDLAKEDVIISRDLGKWKEYHTKLTFPGALYRTKQNPDVPLPQLHGLTMTTEYDYDVLARIEGLGLGLELGKDYKLSWSPGRIITYRFGANSVLTVYLQATLAPLGFEEFKHFLSFLEGCLHVETWARLDQWTIHQYGLNKDIFTMQTNEQITLAAIGNFFSQVYDKVLLDGTRVQRYEWHVNEAMVAQEFMTLFQGGVTSYIQQQLAYATNTLVRDLAQRTQGSAKNDRELTQAIWLLIEELRSSRDRGSAAAAPAVRFPPDAPGGASAIRITKKRRSSP